MAEVVADSLTEKPRIASIDLLRGIVMVIMALDHSRDFFHWQANLFDPTDLDRTYPALFFTRWITHFCAPVFVLLSGVAIRISAQRKSKRELSLFLLTRGLWLVFLEAVVMRLLFTFQLYFDLTIFQVIWAIGASMIVLSACIFAGPRFILLAGLVLLFGHDALNVIQLQPGDSGYSIWVLLEQTGFLRPGSESVIMVLYPLIPWLSVMMLGYSIGTLYTPGNTVARKIWVRRIGLAAIALFVLLRFMNVYGDPKPWSQQQNALYTFMSFINCTKYPASLLYLLMTLGPSLLLLSFLDEWIVSRKNPLLVFGRVPLFYYLLHFLVLHIVALFLYMMITNTVLDNVDFHTNFGMIPSQPSNAFGGIPFGYGYGLGWVYVAWIGVVIALYPVCKKYNTYKSTHRDWWLSYL